MVTQAPSPRSQKRRWVYRGDSVVIGAAAHQPAATENSVRSHRSENYVKLGTCIAKIESKQEEQRL